MNAYTSNEYQLSLFYEDLPTEPIVTESREWLERAVAESGLTKEQRDKFDGLYEYGRRLICLYSRIEPALDKDSFLTLFAADLLNRIDWYDRDRVKDFIRNEALKNSSRFDRQAKRFDNERIETILEDALLVSFKDMKTLEPSML